MDLFIVNLLRRDSTHEMIVYVVAEDVEDALRKIYERMKVKRESILKIKKLGAAIV